MPTQFLNRIWFAFAGFSTLLIVGSVTPDGVAARQGTSPAAEQPASDNAQRASAKLDSEVLEKLSSRLKQAVEEGEVSGVIGLVSRDGQRGYFEAFGWRDIEAREPLEKDAIFRLKSMSKPIVTVAALILHDDGKFELDEPISKHLPEWKAPQVLEDGQLVAARTQITPRMLMSHSSGLYYQLPGKPAFSGMPPRDKDTTLEEYSRALASQPLSFHPGENYRYGTSIDVLGRYIEAVSGQALDDFLRTRLFEPLGMVDTDFWVPPPKQNRLAQLYRQTAAGKLAPALERFPPVRPTKLFMGGAGLLSTTADYERFCQMLLHRGELDGQRILKPETVDLMFENHLPESLKMKYGLGGLVDEKGGYAWGGANGTQFWIDRQQNLFAVFMVQTQNYKPPTYHAFRELVIEAAGIPASQAGLGNNRVGSLLQLRDADKDGKLERGEIPEVLFELLDKDADGVISEAERRSFRSRERRDRRD